MDKNWYLIAYDVRDAKRLRRVARLLEGYGSRLQYSLFRCKLAPRELERLQWELTKLMESEDDLLILGLCGQCAKRVRVKSNRTTWDAKEVTFEIV